MLAYRRLAKDFENLAETFLTRASIQLAIKGGLLQSSLVRSN